MLLLLFISISLLRRIPSKPVLVEGIDVVHGRSCHSLFRLVAVKVVLFVEMCLSMPFLSSPGMHVHALQIQILYTDCFISGDAMEVLCKLYWKCYCKIHPIDTAELLV